MAENKTQPTAESVAAFLDAVPDDARRSDAKAICALMEEATGLEPVMWGPAIVGFGSYHYVYDSGREGDSCRIGFSPRKAETVVYGLGPERQAALFAKLGKHKTGKGCLYIKRLSDVDARVLTDLITDALAHSRETHPQD